jgi:hypothetical protein
VNNLKLESDVSIARRLSSIEYFHAAAGSSPNTLDPARIINVVIEGDGALPAQQWVDALQSVAQVNAGLRLRIEGSRRTARWTSEAVPLPQVRFLENFAWDGLSHRGLEAIEAQPLPLNCGPGMELVITTGSITRVILRVRHAVMDGVGILYFLEELFRALRGEPLLGTNAKFSDVDLMRAVAGMRGRIGREKPIPLTGGARGASRDDVWQRLTLPAQPGAKNLMGRVASAAARYARNFMSGPVRIAIPVDLRRHMAGLKSTMNYAGLVGVELNPGETAEDFRHKLRKLLETDADTGYPPAMEALRYLPFTWLDRLSGRTTRNYLQRNLMETIMITNMGIVQPAAFSCSGFRAHNYYPVTLAGNSHITMTTCGAHLNFVVGMPELFASDGRLEGFIDLLREELSNDASAAAGSVSAVGPVS